VKQESSHTCQATDIHRPRNSLTRETVSVTLRDRCAGKCSVTLDFAYNLYPTS